MSEQKVFMTGYRQVTSEILSGCDDAMEAHGRAESMLELELERVRESRRELINRTNANKCKCNA